MWVKRAGFTIVELLVVIVIIGILAVITAVSYNAIQKQGHDSTVQAEIHNFGRKITDYYYKNGSYPDTAVKLNSLKFEKTAAAYLDNSWTFQYCKSDTEFVIAGESRSEDAFFYSSKTGSVAKRSGARAANWCRDNFSMSSYNYSAWARPSESWSGSRSSTGQ